MISHRHQCIFVHIPKTGGTSLEQLIWPDESKRSEADLWMGFVDRYHNRYQTGGLQHLYARHIRWEVGEEIFSRYFKFAFVRNPWDRLVSQYVFMSRRRDLRRYAGMRKRDDFKRYLELIGRREHVQWAPQLAFLNEVDGTRLVDHVGRFENFAEAAAVVLDKLGLRADAIPHHKRGARSAYQDYYDDESRARVAEMYAADIAAFGYQFEPDGASG